MYEVEERVEEAKPNLCKTCCYFIWKLVSCIFSHIILVSLVVAYCILGAKTFESLEAAHEVQVKAEVSAFRAAVSHRLWNMTKNVEVLRQENWTREVKEYLKEFETDLLTAMKKNGWDGTEDQEVTQWTFAGALFYSIIVITTIGYGHIAPKTHWGKVVTILYAILGIPLMLLCLSNIGDIMAHSFRFIYWRVCCYMCTRKPKRVPSRRGRSIKGTVRSSGGRYSGRSRSLRQPHSRAYEAAKSADSALGQSDSFTRSSYSDTECRYNDVEWNGERQFRPPYYKYSEAMASGQAGDILTHTGVPVKPMRTKSEPKSRSVGPDFGRFEVDEMELRSPVLFNKYAVDGSEVLRTPKGGKINRGSNTLPRQQHQEYGPTLDYQASPYGGSLKRNPYSDRGESAQAYSSYPRNYRRAHTVSSPRIMSPMGFAVARHSSYRSPRMGRMREDMEFADYEIDDFEYELNSGSQAAKIRPVPIWLCVFLVVSYIFGGAFLFSKWENWHFLDSAYFCFITLTTIGFGDFVPAQRVQKDAEISIALCSLYLLFGISLLAMSFNLVQEEVINSVKSIAKRLGVIKEDDDDIDDDI